MKIFQAYYKDDQKIHLDPEFTPFDNTANPVVNLHEYYIYTKIYEEAMKSNEDLWGHFSWQWKKKLENVPAAQIIDIIKKNPGADVYTFFPYPWETVANWNVWEHGQWCHPNMLKLAERILTDMGEDPIVLQTPMGHQTYMCVNYFVGNKKFWDGLLEFLNRFVNACEQLPEEYMILLNESAGYEPNLKLDYRGFICERMISTYLVLNHEKLLIRPLLEGYHYRLSQELKDVLKFKDLGIENKDRDMLRQYIIKRNENLDNYNWGKDWVDTCVL
jgi:hypothetical protein